MTYRRRETPHERTSQRSRVGSLLRKALFGLAIGATLTPTVHAAEEEDSDEAVPIEVASKRQKENAKKQLTEGIDLFKESKFDEALEMFRVSYSKVSSPNTRLMIARCLVELKRYTEAYHELTATLDEAQTLARGASKYENTAKAAQAELDKVTKQVSIVELDVGAEVTLGGQPLPPDQWRSPLILQPGPNTLELKLSNGETKRVTVDLQPGQRSRAELAIDAPTRTAAPAPVAAPASAAPMREDPGVARSTLGWTGIGVGAAGVIGFTVFGLLAVRAHDQLQSECIGTRCPESLRDVAENGRAYQTYANVSGAIGVVGLVAGVYFFLSDSSPSTELAVESPKAESPKAAKPKEKTAGLLLGPNRVAIAGTF